MACINELHYILIISIFNFLIFIHFTKQITLKPSLAQKLKLIFKFSTIKGQINVPLWTHMGHKVWRKDGKIFMKCYTIALKFWDKFNANFVLLYLSSYGSIKMWHLYLENVEKNSKAVHLKWVLTYLFNTKKHLTLALKKIVHLLFCVFQTKLNKAVNIFCILPEWIRNAPMIPGFITIKTWMRI